MNKMSPMLGAAAIIIVAAMVVMVATGLVLVPAANAQVRILPSCTHNPGYANGEPPHQCPGLRVAA